MERLAASLEKSFEVSHAAGSTVMDISFTWGDPEIAQAVVKDWVETYINERTQALGRKSLYVFYEARCGHQRHRDPELQQQILEHLNEIGAASITDRLEDLSERINVLRGETFNTQRLIASSDSAIASTRTQLKTQPKVTTVRQILLDRISLYLSF